MVRLLLDANLSPETAIFLSNVFGFDVVDLISLGLGDLADDEVVAVARRQRRAVVTFDLDFGEIYHRNQLGRFGAIILRLSDQTVESVIEALRRLFEQQPADDSWLGALLVVDDHKIRIVTEPPER